MVALKDIDLTNLRKDLDDLHAQACKRISMKDVYYSMCWVAIMHAFFVFGFVFLVWRVPFLSIACFAIYACFVASNRHSLWHVVFDNIAGAPSWMHSSRYATGFWNSLLAGIWFVPSTHWIFVHNRNHHFFTTVKGVDADRNVEDLKRSKVPRLLRPIIIITMSPIWAILYSLKILDCQSGHLWRYKPWDIWRLNDSKIRYFWLQTMLPVPLFTTALYLIAALALGKSEAHLFLVYFGSGYLLGTSLIYVGILVSHNGFDIYRVTEGHYSNKEEFYLQQALTSVNFESGNHLWDNMFSFLNYQIEHHLFPNLPVYQYRWLRPQVKEVFSRYGVQYNEGRLISRYLYHTLTYVFSKRDCNHLNWNEFQRKSASKI